MADRTALTAGIAAASIAAVVAATPALITPPNQDVQVTASAAAALAKKTVSTDVQLAAFTLSGFLLAFSEGYVDEADYFADEIAADIAAAEVANGPATLTDEEIAAIKQAYALSGEAGAIYYALDNLLPAGFDYDDHLYAIGGGADFTEVYYQLAAALGVPAVVVSAVLDPFGTAFALAEGLGLPPVVGGLVFDPILTVLALAESVGVPPVATGLITDPILTVLAVAEGVGVSPLVTGLITDPILTLQAVAVGLGAPPNVVRLITEPVVAAFDVAEAAGLPPVVGDFVADPVITAAKLIGNALPGAQNLNAGLRVASTEVSSDVPDSPKLVNLDLPKPKEIVADIETAVKDTKPLKKLKVNFDGPGAKLAKEVSTSLKKAASEAKKEAPKLGSLKKKKADKDSGADSE